MSFHDRFPPDWFVFAADAKRPLISDIAAAMNAVAEHGGEESLHYVAGATGAILSAHRRGLLHRLDALACDALAERLLRRSGEATASPSV